MSTAIEKIHNAARTADAKILDQRLYYDSDLHLFDLVDSTQGRKGYFDVPLRNIIALGRRDFWEYGDSWRDATLRLHGRSWSGKVFPYFEGALEEKPFPADESLYQLRLTCIGGACECGNGNHRLVAAKAWLAAQYGDAASLKKAKVSHYPIRADIKPILDEAQNRDECLWISPVGFHQRSFTRVGDEAVNAFYRLGDTNQYLWASTDSAVFRVRDSRTWVQKCLPWLDRNTQPLRDWDMLPKEVVNAILDDAWVPRAGA